MKDHIPVRPSKMIAPLLATAIILLIGTAFCIAILLAFGEGKPLPIAVAIGSALLFGMLLWSWRDRPQAEKRGLIAWMLQRNQQPELASYRLGVIRHKQEYGRNQPPTVEQLRDLKDPTRTWVPHQGSRPDEETGGN